MAGSEGGRGPGVQDEGSLLPLLLELVRGEGRRVRPVAEVGGALDVVDLHPSEVRSVEVLLLDLEPDELLPIQLQNGVHEALQTNGAHLPVCYLATADGAWAVSGAEDDVVPQGEEPVEDAVVEVLGPLPLLPGAPEVCSTGVVDEEGVASADEDGLLPDCCIRHGDRDIARCVAGGVDGGHLELANLELLPVGDDLPVLELGPGAVVDVRPSEVRELQGADDVVLVAVGLEDMPDVHPLPLGDVDVDLAVPPGVHDDGLSAGADEVGQM